MTSPVLRETSGMPERTVRFALAALRRAGRVRVLVDLRDARRRAYAAVGPGKSPPR